MLEIPARDALNILRLHSYFEEKIPKKTIIEVWKENPGKSFEELKCILQEKLPEKAA
jgi:hypothetical protein